MVSLCSELNLKHQNPTLYRSTLSGAWPREACNLKTPGSAGPKECLEEATDAVDGALPPRRMEPFYLFIYLFIYIYIYTLDPENPKAWKLLVLH